MAGRTVRGLFLVLTILTTSAFGYEDTGFDPDDTLNCAAPDNPKLCAETRVGNPDIRSTTRKVRQSSDGRRFLSVTIRSFAPVMASDWWVAQVWADSRDGRRSDYRLAFRSPNDGRPRCGIVEGSEVRRGKFRATRWAATCVVPLRYLRPAKKIRWRVTTDYYFPEPYATWDYAPSRFGWYA